MTTPGFREQGLRSGESTRLPSMWPGFQSQTVDPICELNLLLGSLPCSERFFSGYSGFPLSLKTNNFKFQLDQERKDTFQRVLILSVPWVKQIAISNYWSSQWNNCQLALIWISNKANKSTVFRLLLQNKMFQLFMFPSDVLTLLPKFELYSLIGFGNLVIRDL